MLKSRYDSLDPSRATHTNTIMEELKVYYDNYGNLVFSSEEERLRYERDMALRHMTRAENTIWNDSVKNRDEFLRTEAFSRLENSQSGTMVLDKRGAWHCVLDTPITEVYHFTPHRLHRMEGRYMIVFGCCKEPLEITDTEFSAKGMLIDKITQHTKQEVRLLVSKRHTNELLRQLVLKNVREIYLQFHFGWEKCESGWKFNIERDTTHSYRNLKWEALQLVIPSIPVKTAGAELVVGKQMAHFLGTITNREVRTAVTLWLHTSVLTTLVKALGYRLQMGLCLFSDDAGVLRRLEAMLGCYGDKTIELSASKRMVEDQLCERKDQVALLRDRLIAKGNDDLVVSAINAGEFTVEENKTSFEVEVNSLVTLLSNSISRLNQSGYFAVIEVAASDFKKVPDSEMQQLKRYVNDYLRGFCGYVSSNLESLETYLSCGMDDACERGELLNQEGMMLLGVLMGVGNMVQDYLAQLAPEEELRKKMEDALCPRGFDKLIKALESSAEMNCNGDDLVNCFQTIVGAMIAQNRFDSRQIRDDVVRSDCEKGKVGITYSDETYICFSREAFRAVCDACGVTVPVMCKALRDAGFLKGTTVNAETYLTRVAIYDANGAPQPKRVYKFDRADLNQ